MQDGYGELKALSNAQRKSRRFLMGGFGKLETT